MANNRLFIVDTETGERIMLAKSNGDGWWIWYKDDKAMRVDELTEWLQLRDLDASYGNTSNQPSRLRLVTENEPDDPCAGKEHIWKQYASHLCCERCNDSIEIDCP